MYYVKTNIKYIFVLHFLNNLKCLRYFKSTSCSTQNQCLENFENGNDLLGKLG